MNKEDSISLSELDSHLFKCADKIRNTVDKTDYKHYILPIVFYKSINDTYMDKYEELLEEFDGDEEIARKSSFHKFDLPGDYTWEEFKKVNKNLDEFLDDAFDALMNENKEKLGGLFKNRFTNASGLEDHHLKRLRTHLDKESLSLKRVPPDLLGEAYMDLVRHFAQEEGREGGEFFTPPNIVKTIVRVLAPFEKGDEFHDPTCGSAGMLIECAHYFNDEQGGDPKKLTLTGQEMNPDIASISKMNLFLHGYNGTIEKGDSLRDPKFKKKDNELKKFDYVLANFPFSAHWDKDELKDDPFGRFQWGMARADRADYAFIQHMIAQLKDTGKLGVVIPHGVLFRKHEKKFRKGMIEGEGLEGNEILEAVIGLPENLFQNNSIPSGILVVNRDKPEERKGEVLFIHAADEDFYEELSNQNKLTEEGIEHIVDNFREWKTEERVSRAVPLDEIRENDYNLNIALYVDTTEPEEDIDVSEELKKLKELQAEREEIEERMDEHMEVLGYE